MTPTSRRTRYLVTAGAVALTVSLTGCSSGHKPAVSGNATTTSASGAGTRPAANTTDSTSSNAKAPTVKGPPASTTSTTVTKAEASASAQAKGALLTASDLGLGWQPFGNVVAVSTPNAQSAQTASLANCLGLGQKAGAPSAYAPTFENKDGTVSVSDQVAVYQTVAGAQVGMSVDTSTKTPACLTGSFAAPIVSQLKSHLPAGATVTPSAALVAFNGYGDASGEAELKVAVNDPGGKSYTTVSDSLVVRVGTAVSFITVLYPQGANVAALEAQAATASATHLHTLS